MEDDGMIDFFLDEAREHMSTVEECLLVLEKNGFDQELVNKLFRAVHTIKGGSGFFGLSEIGELSHALEDVLVKIRDKALGINSNIINSLLKSLDILNGLLNEKDFGKGKNVEAIISEVRSFITGGHPSAGKALKPKIEGISLQERSADQPTIPPEIRGKIDKSKLLYRIEFAFKAFRQNVDLQSFGGSLLAYLKSIGKILHCPILLEKLDKRKSGSVIFYFQTVLEKGILMSAFGLPEGNFQLIDHQQGQGSENIKKEPGLLNVAEKAMPLEKLQTLRKGISSLETIKIKVDLLDKIMTLAGEILLSRNQLLRQYSTRKDNATLITHSQHISELQESVMKTRLQPVGMVFGKFRRIVRDLAFKIGKKINLNLYGEDVELDRSIIDCLSDPLTHLIRNCVDHALENPDEREKAGKSRTGNIFVRALHEGGHVVIEVEDDGRGIDVPKIKKKSIEKKFITEEEATKMSENELAHLIFIPGLSTVEKVSDISGRGVGMDVVKTSFEKLGGSCDIRTTMGKGSCITIRLPLTLAIIPSLIVTVENCLFAVPEVDVMEMVRIKKGTDGRKIEVLQGQNVYRLRGKLLPVVRLADVLGLKRTRLDETTGLIKEEQRKAIADRRHKENTSQNNIPIKHRKNKDRRKKNEIQRLMVLQYGADCFGLLVDFVLDPEEIVVKPLPECLQSSKVFSASTIMGDGKVAMILDIEGIVSVSGFKFDCLEVKAPEIDEEQVRRALQERQNVIIFNNSEEDFFAVPLSMVSRIEKIENHQIEKVGKKEYVQLRGKSVNLLRLENYLSVKPSDRSEKELFIVIPNIIKCNAGIVATNIVDVLETAIVIDTDSISEPGILGSCILGKRITMMLDLFTLFELADPEHFSDKGKNRKNLQGGDYKVLLVEDTPFFRVLEKKYLESEGFKVVVAGDGEEGFKILQKDSRAFDIVVSDIEMPVMDGLELVKKIKSNDNLCHLPVLALTALANEESVKKGEEAGFDAYEIKLDRESVLNRIYNLINRS